MAQIPANVAAWPVKTFATLGKPSRHGRPRQHARVNDPMTRPLKAAKWKEALEQQPQAWFKIGLAHGPIVRATALRVLASRRHSRIRQPGPERWLLIEQLPDATYKYYFSNFPTDVPVAELIELVHHRWKVEQGYQQLKEELGLDHFEGRSWRGLHHHLTLCLLAYGFLTRLRRSMPKKTSHPA